MGCAKTAGFVISLESLKRLFRGRIALREWESIKGNSLKKREGYGEETDLLLTFDLKDYLN
jgi:hypothetical protein